MKQLFNNTRGQTSLTKSGMLLVIIIFYTVIFIIIGYVNTYFGTSTMTTTTTPNTTFFGFITNVISGVTSLPWWLNSIIFGTLVIIITWILLSSLPTFNGGG